MTAAQRVPFSLGRGVRIAGFAHALRNFLRFAGVRSWHLMASAPVPAEDPEFNACSPIYRNCVGRQLGVLQTSPYLTSHAAGVRACRTGCVAIPSPGLLASLAWLQCRNSLGQQGFSGQRHIGGAAVAGRTAPCYWRKNCGEFCPDRTLSSIAQIQQTAPY
jgi:hypothetical protein